MFRCRVIGVAVPFFILSGVAASAATGDLHLKYNTPGPHSPLLDQHLYEVRISCSATAPLPNGRTGISWIDNANATGSHYIAIATDPPTLDASTGAIKLPDTLKALIPLYSFKGASNLPLEPSCSQSLVIAGGQKYYLIPVESFSTTHAPGILLSLVWSVASAIPSVFSVFAPIPTGLSTKLTNIDSTQDSLTKLLTTLNVDENYGTAIDLTKGSFRVSSSYSMTTIDVLDLPSIIKSDTPSIRKSFRDQLDAATDKITPDSGLASTCRSIADALAVTGMSQDDDVPYAVAYRAIKSSLTKTQIMECLSPDLALRAAQLGTILWSDALPSQQVSADDVLNYFPPSDVTAVQPSYSIIRPKVFSLVNQMSIISKIGVDDPDVKNNISALNALMMNQVVLNDQSGQFASAPSPLAPLDLLKLFLQAKYVRFGCFTEDTDSTGKFIDSAVAIFLALKPSDKDPTTTTLDNVLAVHVLYLQGLVSKVTVLDDEDFTAAVLDPAKWSCNGFSVVKPKSAANQ